MQKKGNLYIVASTGGLKFIGKDQEWMNPAKDITAEGLDHLKSLKGKYVVINFNDKGKYIRCEIDVGTNSEIKSNPSAEPQKLPETNKSEGIQKMNISVSLSKDYNTIKLELLDVEMNGSLSRRIQEKIDFLKEEINKAHNKIDG